MNKEVSWLIPCTASMWYFEGRIYESNLRKQRDGIEEVVQHLSVLREAWAAMLRGEGPQAIAEPLATQGLTLAGARY